MGSPRRCVAAVTRHGPRGARAGRCAAPRRLRHPALPLRPSRAPRPCTDPRHVASAQPPRTRREKTQFPPAPDFTRRECNPVCRRASPSGLPRPGPRGPSHSRWAPQLPSGARTVPTRHAPRPPRRRHGTVVPARPSRVRTNIPPSTLTATPAPLPPRRLLDPRVSRGRAEEVSPVVADRKAAVIRAKWIIFILLLFCII